MISAIKSIATGLGINSSSIYSTLGSNSSLVPLAIKDVANSVGMTAGSYITGKKTEGEDRFIDEFGTQAIWLGGIPFFKKLTDLTLYKALKIDPEFDVRNFKNKEVLNVLLEKTPDNLKNSVEKAIKNPNFTKNLSIAKFGISTALTVVSYLGLTKYRQHHRLQQAIKEEKLKQQNSNKTTDTNKQTNNKNISFKGGFQDFMINPVKNLMILDGVITEERLRNSESKQEFINYSIKEGTTWGFMYFAGPVFQKFFENRAMQKHNIPINFDSRIIENKDLDKALKDGTLKNSIEQYEKILEMTEVEIVDGTQIMAISVKSTDPEISLALLNEIMDLLPEAVAKTADGAECHVVTRPYQVNGGSPVERSHVSVIVISFVLGLVESVFVLTLFCIFSGKGDEQPGKNSEGKIGSAG